MHEQVLKEIISWRVEILVLFHCPYLSSLVENVYKKSNIFIFSIKFFLKLNESERSFCDIKLELKKEEFVL